MNPLIQDGAIVLFQGDSVTDAGRDRRAGEDLGRGYAMMAAAWFSALYPDRRVRWLNRGTSGDRAADLRRRWRKDCLALGPTWVSILIGINDTWRRYDSGDPTTVAEYEAAYRMILEETCGQLNARLVVCEPFLLPTSPGQAGWREDLEPKIAVLRNLAREYQALLVPLDGIFTQAATRRPPAFWAADGVHPTPAGHALIAQAWLRALRAHP
jgi:acyl-CoA thioesterase-1